MSRLALSSDSSPGTVRLKNAVFFARHGVTHEEHRVGGRYEVDVEMDLDFSRAAENDDLRYTVDYEKVYSLAKEIVLGNSFYLIERLAFKIAHAVLEEFPLVTKVEATVRKVNPPVGGPADGAEATWRAVREEV